MQSHTQSSEIFDSEQVLQQVRRGDYPPTWRVFFGPVGNAAGCSLVTAQVLLGGLALFFLAVGVFGAITGPISQAMIGGLILMGVIILILIGLIILLGRGVQGARRRASEQPRSTMVVMPEGVVSYRRRRTRSLLFAHIAQMQLIVRTKRNLITTYTTITNPDSTIFTTPSTTTVPWLKLVFQNGQKGIWRIDTAPQNAIAQAIFEAYNRYRINLVSDEP